MPPPCPRGITSAEDSGVNLLVIVKIIVCLCSECLRGQLWWFEWVVWLLVVLMRMESFSKFELMKAAHCLMWFIQISEFSVFGKLLVFTLGLLQCSICIVPLFSIYSGIF